MKRFTPFFILALLGVLAMACITSASLAAVTPTPSPTPTPDILTGLSKSCTVTAEALNLRSGPGTSYQVIDWLRAGDVLTITQAGAWLAVRTADGLTGWVNSYYCTIGE